MSRKGTQRKLALVGPVGSPWAQRRPLIPALGAALLRREEGAPAHSRRAAWSGAWMAEWCEAGTGAARSGSPSVGSRLPQGRQGEEVADKPWSRLQPHYHTCQSHRWALSQSCCHHRHRPAHGPQEARQPPLQRAPSATLGKREKASNCRQRPR